MKSEKEEPWASLSCTLAGVANGQDRVISAPADPNRSQVPDMTETKKPQSHTPAWVWLEL